MASPQKLKEQIENANALGIQNLSDKGVDISASATTYEIMQSIADVQGGGAEYTSIVFSENNTITLTDTGGVVHTMVCDYAEGKLVSASYDGKEISLTYDGEDLIGVGGTVVNLSNVHCILPKMMEHISTALIEQGNITASTALMVKESV